MPQMNETILLLVVGSTVFFALVRFVKARRPVAAEIMHVPVGWGLPSTGWVRLYCMGALASLDSKAQLELPERGGAGGTAPGGFLVAEDRKGFGAGA